MCVEVMYFNHLSRICNYLKNRSDVVGIASYFHLPPKTFNSWLHTINYVRNICAHHARLWNRDFNIVPEKLDFSKTLVWISNPETAKRGKLYYFLCMLNYILQTINPGTSLTQRLKDLIAEYHPKISAMGFPENWGSHSTLYRKVKAITGLSIAGLIRMLRAREAAILLENDRYTVSEIAFMVGMSNPGNFRQCFREEFGTTPSEYRNSHRK